MRTQYSFLEPVKVGPKTFKNRVVLAAMAKWCCPDGFISEQFLNYYGSIADGGTALITPGIMVIDPDWPYISSNQPRLSDDKFIPGLKKFAERMHKAGALACCQLWHPGLAGAPGHSLNNFSIDQIHHIQELYKNAARRVKEAGVDCVDFHAAHTYLPSQFLSPHFNKRTDLYGADTVENAMRFSTEIIEWISNNLCDDDFFMTAKINGSDFIEGGTTPERAAQASILLEKAGISMITVNGGGVLTKITGMSDDGKQPEGWKVPFAETVKKSISIPVAACGSIRSPKYADAIIREGKCDLVSIGRGLVAEPQWVIKAQQGREDEMRYCISCMYCFTASKPGISGCSVNPYVKRENENQPLIKNGAGREIIVVGAGPSGLEAAITLAEREFSVTVVEEAPRIGGQVYLAALPPGKAKLNWLIDYYQREITRLGINVRLNTQADSAMITAMNPYAVVMATGSSELIPPIPGIDNANVVSVRDVLEKSEEFKNRNCIILGGGLTGLETARLLFASGNRVTVLEMLDLTTPPNMETKLAIDDIRGDEISLKDKHKVLQIEKDKVIALNLDTNEQVTFAADTVILSLGIRPNTKMIDELQNIGLTVFCVGDCANLGKICTAVQSGNTVGCTIN